MRELGLPDAATALLSTLRRTADRPAQLLLAVRYERALAYAAAGQPKRARAGLGLDLGCQISTTGPSTRSTAATVKPSVIGRRQMSFRIGARPRSNACR